MSAKPSLDEAKRKFAEAMEGVSLSEIVRAHPIKSVAVTAAAGALTGLSSRRLARALLPILELTGWASRIFSK